LASGGFVLAGYLALYQAGFISGVWEPFFGLGAIEVLYSRLWSAVPVPDAAILCAGYFAAAVTGALGGRARWRTRPRLVVAFGAIVAALAAFNLLLVLLKAWRFAAWCTLCLALAVLSLLMTALAAPEVAAALRRLRPARRGQ
jgi:hypothetical protein